MWKPLLCIFSAHIFAMDPGEVGGDCPSGWSAYPRGKSCLRVFPRRMKWSQAESTCIEEGARLAGVADEYENSFVYEIARRANLSTPTVWLGRIDRVKVGGAYDWSDGTNGRYSAGFRGNVQPNNSQCVTMWLDLGRSEGSWQLWDCGYNGYAAICKRPFIQDASAKSSPSSAVSTHLSQRCCLKQSHCTMRCPSTERCVPDDLNCLINPCNNTRGWCLPKL